MVQVLKMLDLPDELMLLLCTKPKEARIHVDFLGGLQPERLQQRINPAASWTHVVAFRPTGDSLTDLNKPCTSLQGKPVCSLMCPQACTQNTVSLQIRCQRRQR